MISRKKTKKNQDMEQKKAEVQPAQEEQDECYRFPCSASL